jgi:chemotaxis protein MotA
MDIGTVIGLIFGFGVIVTALLMGGGVGIFIDIPSVFIVVGGMLCASMIHFSLPQVLAIFAIIKKTVMIKLQSPHEIIQQMVNFAAINRRDGALALEEQVRKINNPFLAKGLQMLADGQDEDAVRELMNLEIQYLQERHSVGKKILEFMGASAPAFGMLGTLIGLVQMLRNLSSPSDIGAGMAVALITTFYGAILANLVFIPLAGKLGLYSKAEIFSMEMIVEGICTICRGENPTVVREKMQAFISPNRRQEVKATI